MGYFFLISFDLIIYYIYLCSSNYNKAINPLLKLQGGFHGWKNRHEEQDGEMV